MSATAPQLWTVILNWRRPDDTIACLAGVVASRYPNLRVLVVDNGADDVLASRVAADFSQVVYLRNSRNLGYTGGNNVGMRYALDHCADFVVLLNDDVLVDPDTFDSMIAAARDPRVAAVGPKVKVYQDPGRIWAAGQASSREDAYPLDRGQFDRPRDLSYAVGCCILMRGSVVAEVGLLPDAFFAIHGEKDWCYRARRAGYRIVYAPEATVMHKTSDSLTSGRSALTHYLFVRNELLFAQRQGITPAHRPSWPYTFLVWRKEVGHIWRCGRSRLFRTWWATRGVLDYVRGRFGPPPARLLI